MAVQTEPYGSQKCVAVIHNLCTLLVTLSVKNAVNEEELVVYIKIWFVHLFSHQGHGIQWHGFKKFLDGTQMSMITIWHNTTGRQEPRCVTWHQYHIQHCCIVLYCIVLHLLIIQESIGYELVQNKHHSKTKQVIRLNQRIHYL